MVRIERGNKVLHVEEAELKHYLEKGYNQTDILGNVITQAVPNTTELLQARYVEQTEKIAELENTIARLKAEIVELQSAAEKKATKKKS